MRRLRHSVPRWAFPVAVVAIAPLVPFVFSRSWAMGTAGWLDSWFYFGYFSDLSGTGEFAETNYKASRLPWLLVGNIGMRLFGDTGVFYFIAATALASSAVLGFLIARRFFGRPLSMLLGIGLAFVPTIHASTAGGWTYHNSLLGPTLLAGVLAALTFAAPTSHVRRGSSAWPATLAFGACLIVSGLLLTHSALMLLAVWGALLTIGPLRGSGVLRAAGRDALGIAAGAAGAYIGLGLVNVAIGKTFWFHTPLWSYLQEQTQSANAAVWREPWEVGWWMNATWLAPVTLAFLASIALGGWCLANGTPAGFLRPRSSASACVWASGATTLAFILLYLAGYQSIDNPKTAFPLQIAAFVGLIGVAALAQRVVALRPRSVRQAEQPRSIRAHHPSNRVLIVTAALAPGVALGLGAYGSDIADWLESRLAPSVAFLLVGTTVATGVVCTVLLGRRSSSFHPWTTYFAVPVVWMAVWVPTAFALNPMIRASNYLLTSDCKAQQVGTKAVLAAWRTSVAALEEQRSREAPLAVWGDSHPPSRDCLPEANQVANSTAEALQTVALLSGTLWEHPPVAAIPTSRLADALGAGGIALLGYDEDALAGIAADISRRTGVNISRTTGSGRISDGGLLWTVLLTPAVGPAQP